MSVGFLQRRRKRQRITLALVLVCSHQNLTEPGGVLTCFCEPGGGRVGIDCAKSDHLAEFSSFTDCDTDERVGLFRDHQHFKDLQRTG